MSNEELKLKLSVIISATNTSGNQKLDAIMELFNQLHPSPTPDVTEAVFTKDDMGSAVEFGYRQYKKYGYISPKEEEDFINSKTKNNEQQ